MGIQLTLVIPFTKKFSLWSPERFVEQLLVKKLHIKEVVVGHDFGFGRDRAGTVESLRAFGKKYGFKVHVVPPYKVGSYRIPPRALRELIRAGNLKKAARFLGRPVSAEGIVVHGDGRGKKIGFPTANIKVTAGVLPPLGVYAVRVLLGKKVYRGMANLGFRPTFHKKHGEPVLEVHLFGMKKKLTGQPIRVDFLIYLRPERKFPSAEALHNQLLRDAARAKLELNKAR